MEEIESVTSKSEELSEPSRPESQILMPSREESKLSSSDSSSVISPSHLNKKKLNNVPKLN